MAENMPPDGKRVQDFDEGWSYVQEAIDKVKSMFKASASESESAFKCDDWMLIYTLIYNMCSRKPPDSYSTEFHHKFIQTFDQHITSEVLPSLREKQDDCESMLREFVDRWVHNKLMVRAFSFFFGYLDRYYTSQNKLQPIKEFARTRFHDLVFLQVMGKVRDLVISAIDRERKGDQINRGLLKDVLDIFVEAGKTEYYENEFEEIMLRETAAYYSEKASHWIVQDSFLDYISKVEQSLKDEKDRASHYLHSSSERKLMEIVHNELLIKYANQLIEHEEGIGFEFIKLLTNNEKLEYLSRVYRIFRIIPEWLELTGKMFRQQIRYEAIALVQQHDAKEPLVNYARKVMDLYEKYIAHVIHTCLSKDNIFLKVINEEFDELCNKQVGGSSSSEILSSYCDDILKRASSEKLSGEEFGDSVEKVGKLLGYINDKDMFGEFYRDKLSRRLLIDKSVNQYHEKLILSALKQQYGYQFTSKMEGMVTDITLSKKNQTLWEEYLIEKNKEDGSGNPGGIDFSATVLTTGLWPTSYEPFDHISLPAEMVKCIEVFKEFYDTITNNRKLRWINSLGTCNIQGNFESKTIQLYASTYQAAVLLLFNSADRLSYSEIKTQLCLRDEDDNDLIRILESVF